mmetsp:Transcript_3580/g.4847  ORF Transcript_3580/g.4847 Transcript_3580/m.4847 type:complete len:84 (+) Transcript_3580:2-253(+)
MLKSLPSKAQNSRKKIQGEPENASREKLPSLRPEAPGWTIAALEGIAVTGVAHKRASKPPGDRDQSFQNNTWNPERLMKLHLF